ncbi:unnamed protein product, partial [Prorocentrum cordatum]
AAAATAASARGRTRRTSCTGRPTSARPGCASRSRRRAAATTPTALLRTGRRSSAQRTCSTARCFASGTPRGGAATARSADS